VRRPVARHGDDLSLHVALPICRVETDDGIVGWGEPVVEGRAETVRAAVEELSELLLGQDPTPIEYHWQRLTKAAFYRGGPVLSRDRKSTRLNSSHASISYAVFC